MIQQPHVLTNFVLFQNVSSHYHIYIHQNDQDFLNIYKNTVLMLMNQDNTNLPNDMFHPHKTKALDTLIH